MGGVARRRALLLDLAWALGLALLAALLLPLALRSARPLLVEFGPNDQRYHQGFREDWERDRATRFRWTGPLASVQLPAIVSGSDAVLRLRLRRHFPDPAHVRLRVEGRVVSAFDIAADPRVPYRIVEVPLGDLAGRAPFVLQIEAATDNPRPLGVALDWLDVRGGHVALARGTVLRLVLVVLLAFLAPRAAGGPRWLAATHSVLLGAALLTGLHVDLVAGERMLHEGTAAYVAVAALVSAFGLVRRGPVAGALAAIVLLALAARLALLLHPQFYYPDVRIHSVFAFQLDRLGVAGFLREYIANQFRFSLGLQLERGQWYAFPYPPGFYLLCWPVLKAGFRSEVAVSLVAATVNALTAAGAFVLARSLRQSNAVALGAAAAAALLPLYLVRLSLAYFPAITGHAVDLLVLIFLVRRAGRTWTERDGLVFTALMAAAMLAYVQTILNFAVVLAMYLLIDVLRDARGRRRQLWIVAGCVLGGVLALGLFYYRYLGPVADMAAGRPMVGSEIAVQRLEQEARSAATADEVQPPEEDPYTGPSIDLGRGLRKAGWRLWVFYGPLSAAVIAGLLLTLRRLEPGPARLVACWALAYVVLNLLSGGLPGPNLVRYNKDHELVAPLFCVGLAVVADWLWRVRRLGPALAGGYGAAGLAWMARQGVAALTARFSIER